MERVAAGVNQVAGGAALRQPSQLAGQPHLRPAPVLAAQQVRLVQVLARYQHAVAGLEAAGIHRRQQHLQLIFLEQDYCFV